MKYRQIIECTIAIACNVALISGSYVVLGGTSEKKVLDEEVIKSIHILSSKKLVYLDAIWPSKSSMDNKKIPTSEVPQEVTEKAVKWIRRAIKKEWLPDDLKNRLIPLKDLKKWEKRDKHGIVFSQWVGDYIITEYQIRNHTINIQENGVSLSVFVTLPNTTQISSDPQGFVRQCIKAFLNFPAEKIEKLAYRLQKKDNLYYGNVLCGWKDETAERHFNENGLVTGIWWWQSLTVCTDGSFFLYLYQKWMEGPLVHKRNQVFPTDSREACEGSRSTFGVTSEEGAHPLRSLSSKKYCLCKKIFPNGEGVTHSH